jgi:hypothetical protein
MFGAGGFPVYDGWYAVNSTRCGRRRHRRSSFPSHAHVVQFFPICCLPLYDVG